MRKYVIAGNYQQYKQWLNETNRSPNEFVYVDGVQNLIGLQEVHGYFIGTWNERKDIVEVIKYIRAINKIPMGEIFPLHSNSYKDLTNNWT